MNKRNVRLAGLTFLLYFATSLSDGFLFAHASSGHGTAARLASITQNVAQVRLTILLALLTVLYALILAVTLYALTREVDPELALIALTCRVVEGVINAVPVVPRLGLLSIASTSVTAASADAPSLQTQAALLINSSWWSTTVGATIFSVGSALFAYLFLRGRTIPALHRVVRVDCLAADHSRFSFEQHISAQRYIGLSDSDLADNLRAHSCVLAPH